VDAKRGRLTFDAFRWEPGTRERWSGVGTVTRPGSDLVVERRTVPLITALSDDVREALTACGAQLIETE
jgi:hypothetical protein